VAEWGVCLAKALAVLHAAGFVHRDVKPGNVLFIHGKPCLSDYGLVGEPGTKEDFRGTEGFQPIEGTSDASADLFALGKTLYEVWTGGNRLEFPSLPREVLDAADWDPAGLHLNEVLLRACNNQPRQRFRSASDMAAALSCVVAGQRPLDRRRWLLTAASCSAAGAGLFFFFKHRKAPARVVWRRVREKGLNVESWQGHLWTADWARGRIFSYNADNRGCTFLSVDLKNFDLSSPTISGGPLTFTTILFPPASCGSSWGGVARSSLWTLKPWRCARWAVDRTSTATSVPAAIGIP